MSKTDRNQQILNWLSSEQKKDDIYVQNSKNKIIKEFKGLKKKDMFQDPKKISIWTKIRIIILGN